MDYPSFYKKYKRNTTTDKYHNTTQFHKAELWFQQRQLNYNTQYNNNNHKLPPGLNLTHCTLCNKTVNNRTYTDCCKSHFCYMCSHTFNNHKDLLNRCLICNNVLQVELQYLYEGLDLIIPSYDDFYYIE